MHVRCVDTRNATHAYVKTEREIASFVLPAKPDSEVHDAVPNAFICGIVASETKGGRITRTLARVHAYYIVHTWPESHEVNAPFDLRETAVYLVLVSP